MVGMLTSWSYYLDRGCFRSFLRPLFRPLFETFFLPTTALLVSRQHMHGKPLQLIRNLQFHIVLIPSWLYAHPFITTNYWLHLLLL